jgi:hypothetical protein
LLQERIDKAVECLETFVAAGLQHAMNNFNNK